MGSYAIQSLANGLAQFIQKTKFTPINVASPSISSDTISAITQTISWIGIVLGIFLLAFSTFWLVHAVAAVTTRIPKTFNVGFWAFVFPMGVYTNAVCKLATDLDNSGFKVYGVICVFATSMLWLGCALATTYTGVWRGELFFAPGLEGSHEKQALGLSSDSEKAHDRPSPNATNQSSDNTSSATAYSGRSDGTYTLPCRKQTSSEA